MNVYKKLSEARARLHRRSLNKSGHNKFSNYFYFELGDFLPFVIESFNELGLCGFIKFEKEFASLTVVDTDDPTQTIVILSPMGSANLKGCHEMQNIGAVQTYQRRYLWTTLMELCENDILDSGKEKLDDKKDDGQKIKNIEIPSDYKVKKDQLISMIYKMVAQYDDETRKNFLMSHFQIDNGKEINKWDQSRIEAAINYIEVELKNNL